MRSYRDDVGLRGVMTKYSGFYDLPTAWNQVFGAFCLVVHSLRMQIVRSFCPIMKRASVDREQQN